MAVGQLALGGEPGLPGGHAAGWIVVHGFPGEQIVFSQLAVAVRRGYTRDVGVFQVRTAHLIIDYAANGEFNNTVYKV